VGGGGGVFGEGGRRVRGGGWGGEVVGREEGQKREVGWNWVPSLPELAGTWGGDSREVVVSFSRGESKKRGVGFRNAKIVFYILE